VNGHELSPEVLAKALRGREEPVEAAPELDRELVGLLDHDELARVLTLLPARESA
jgi:hypothetical protein